jgi:16S rRNA (guanine1207-N2)-methyltransferase
MNHKDDHYFKEFSDSPVKFFTVSVSLRRHLFLFKTTTGIFSYKKLDLGTKVLIEHMIIPKSNQVLLDLGCGYGAIGIVLAYESPESFVYLTDISRRALWCTKQNIKINLPRENKKVSVLYGRYFEPFKSKEIKFDGIYMNPPVRLGRKQFLNLFREIPTFLNKNGKFQFVLRRKMGAEFVYNYLKDIFSTKQIEIICKKGGYWVFKYTNE